MKSVENISIVEVSNTTPKVLITKAFLKKVQYLCSRINTVEWSGVLFYKIQGTIKKSNNLRITLMDILPMDKGNSVYTEYSLDNRYIDYLMDNPEAMDWKIGHIHSHNNMAVFFSGTDTDEIAENSSAHNFYLSVVTNNNLDFVAKIATKISAEKQVSVDYIAKDENGENYVFTKGDLLVKKNKVAFYTCNMIVPKIEKIKDDYFTKKVDALFEKKVVVENTKTFTSNKYSGTLKNTSQIDNKKTLCFNTKNFSKPKNGMFPKGMFPKVTPTNDFGFNDIDNLEKIFEEDLSIIEIFIIKLLKGLYCESIIYSNYTNIIHIYEEIDDTIKNEDMLSFISQVIAEYPTIYEDTFKDNNPDTFIDTLNKVIDEMDLYTEEFIFLKHLVVGLDKLKKQFLKYN